MPADLSHAPIQPWLPSRITRKYPTTVGGNTSGNASRAISRFFPANFFRASHHAVGTPSSTTNAVAALATRSDIISDDENSPVTAWWQARKKFAGKNLLIALLAL